MTTLQITEELSKIPAQKAKIYLTTYEEKGYELGFGKAGKYKGHSHLHFYDIIYSPNGFRTKDSDKNELTGNLLIVPPRTWMEDIEIDDFFFIKFCNEFGEISVPEKVDFYQDESKLLILKNNESICLPWYPSGMSMENSIDFFLNNESLSLIFSNKNELKITY